MFLATKNWEKEQENRWKKMRKKIFDIHALNNTHIYIVGMHPFVIFEEGKKQTNHFMI